MENNFEPAISEEQMAAYLDGMLSTEECCVVEEIIYSDSDMKDIMDCLDAVDSMYIYEYDLEIPVEYLTDNFFLSETDDYIPNDDIETSQDDDECISDGFGDSHEDMDYLSFDDNTDLII